MERTTLAEQGARLPIGHLVEEPDKFEGGLACRPWRLKEERELGKIRSDKDQTSGQYASAILCYMLTVFGKFKNFGELPEHEKRLIVNQAPLADVLFAYVWLRTQALGTRVKIDTSCEFCRAPIPWKADLGSMEIDRIEGPEDLVVEHELRDGIEINGNLYREIKIGPPLWAVFEQVNPDEASGFGLGEMKALMIRSGIKAVKGIDNLILTADHLDTMSKFDLEHVNHVIEDRTPGPELVFEIKCGRCRRKFQQAIDWNYDAFFGQSSLW